MVEERPDPSQTIQKLDDQVGEILELYDLGEKLHSYDELHGDRSLNENERRQQQVRFLDSQGQSA